MKSFLFYRIFCLLSVVCFISPAIARGQTVGYSDLAGHCIHDKPALLELEIQQFDRTIGEGWRPIASKAGCELVAADLIAEYRKTRLDPEDDRSAAALSWHEGQMRAAAGQSERAIDRFNGTYRQPERHNADVAWNLYVRATIAFLEEDRELLDATHHELVTLPEPDFWAAAAKRTKETYGYEPLWPNNLNVVEAFQRCFNKSYAEAYGECNEGIAIKSE